jgi:3-methyladenine DNA glycosylase/8-oxoguanine DNA glycosylase
VAFAALIEELKKTINVHTYKLAVTQLAPELGIEYASESAWLTSADKAAAQLYERLDQQLTAAKANLNKFAVRAAHFGLGDYYVRAASTAAPSRTTCAAATTAKTRTAPLRSTCVSFVPTCSPASSRQAANYASRR